MFRLITFIFLVLPFVGHSQYCEQYCEADEEHERREVDESVTNVKEYFLHGHVHGHVRNYFMSTINKGSLTDHYANALGGAIAYSTAEWKGFHFGVKGIFTYNLFSSVLDGSDSTIAAAGWEQELFDVTTPDKINDLDRLEELYASYENPFMEVMAGKIDIDKSPLLRNRDSRMKPFVYRGIWSEFYVGKHTPMFGHNNEVNHGDNYLNKEHKKHTHFYNGFITGVSPRGMTEWYSLNEAIGINYNGMLNDTVQYNYHDKSGTKGLLVNGFSSMLLPKLKLQGWNYYLHNIYNTTWIQGDAEIGKFGAGLQYVMQFSDPHQQNLQEDERYFDADHQSNTLAGQLYYRVNNRFRIRLAHLTSLGSGRFVYPKELSRDDFYTSISRSRFDGYGAANVSLFEIAVKPSKEHPSSFLLLGQVQFANLASRELYQLNKYQLPDYTQFNFLASYRFPGKLQGIHLNFLYVSRFSNIPASMEFEEQYNATNLHHFNLVLDVVF
jgi:hypothetical protein